MNTMIDINETETKTNELSIWKQKKNDKFVLQIIAKPMTAYLEHFLYIGIQDYSIF